MKKTDAHVLEMVAGAGREVASLVKTGIVALSSNQIFSIVAALTLVQWLQNHYYNIESGEFDDVWIAEKGHWALNQPASLAPAGGMGGGSPPIPPGGYEAPGGHYQPGPGQQIGAGGAIIDVQPAGGGGGGYTNWDDPVSVPAGPDLSGPIISIDALPPEDYW